MSQGIYKIENINNGKKYIGSSKNIETRWKQHQRNLLLGKHHSSKLQRAYNTLQNKEHLIYEIIEEVEFEEDLLTREKYYIDLYNSFYNGYNCADIGVFYTEKMRRRKNSAKKTKYYQTLFYNLYDSEYVQISKKWFSKINNYKFPTLKRLCIIMNWFYTYFDLSKYHMRICATSKLNSFSAVINTYDENSKPIEYVFDTENNKYQPVRSYDFNDINTFTTPNTVFPNWKVEQLEYNENILRNK